MRGPEKQGKSILKQVKGEFPAEKPGFVAEGQSEVAVDDPTADARDRKKGGQKDRKGSGKGGNKGGYPYKAWFSGFSRGISKGFMSIHALIIAIIAQGNGSHLYPGAKGAWGVAGAQSFAPPKRQGNGLGMF